jgi:hypothetical protein
MASYLPVAYKLEISKEKIPLNGKESGDDEQ